MQFLNDIAALVTFLRQHAQDLRRVRLSIAVIAAAGALGGFASTVLLALINRVIHVEAAERSTFVVAFVGLCLLLPLMRFISSYVLIALSQRSLYQLRMQLSRQILSAPLAQLERFGTPRLLASLTTDIGHISGALVSLPMLCMHIAIIVGSLSYLLWLSPPVFVGTLVFMLLGVLSYYLPVQRALGHFRRLRETWDSVFEAFEALTEGVKELKQHRPRRRGFLDTMLEPNLVQIQDQSMAGNVLYAAASSWGQALFFILIGLVLFVSPSLTGATAEILSGYALVVLYLMTPLEVLLNTMPTLTQAAVSVQKIQRLGLAFDQVGPESSAPDRVLPEWQELRFEDVTYTYPSEDPERAEEGFKFGPVDFELSPGELVFVVGGNGSGKTTFAKLLLGLYKPDGGHVYFNGSVLDGDSVDDYRQMFSVVFSEGYLFDSLIGIPSESIDRHAGTHLSMFGMDEIVKVENDRYSTTDVSKGQKMRLALVTAYLEDRPVYVFDEWAADQDPSFREVFYSELLPNLIDRGKSVVVITHDDKYFDLAHRIVKFDRGRVDRSYSDVGTLEFVA